jgi:hypothetical protein
MPRCDSPSHKARILRLTRSYCNIPDSRPARIQCKSCVYAHEGFERDVNAYFVGARAYGGSSHYECDGDISFSDQDCS